MPCFARPKVDEQHLIVIVVNDFVESGLEFYFFLSVEVAFEYGVLQVDAITFAQLENFPQTFVVANVVGEKVVASHVNSGDRQLTWKLHEAQK